MTRPFKVLGIQQIAIGGPSKEKLRTLWVDMFGLEVTSTFVSERENVDGDICAMGSGPFKVEVDLMQPLDPEKKPAVHATRSTTSACGSTTCPRPSNGCRPTACASHRRHPQGAAGFDITFLHPKANEIPDWRRRRADRTGAGAEGSGGRLRQAGRQLGKHGRHS